MNKEDKLLAGKYVQTNINWLTFFEGLLIFYFLFGLVHAFYFKNWGVVPLLFLSCTGFSMVFGWTLQERRNQTLIVAHE